MLFENSKNKYYWKLADWLDKNGFEFTDVEFKDKSEVEA